MLTEADMPPHLHGVFDLSSQKVREYGKSRKSGMTIEYACIDCGVSKVAPTANVRTAIKNGKLSGLCVRCSSGKKGEASPCWKGGKINKVRDGVVLLNPSCTRKYIRIPNPDYGLRYVFEHRLVMAEKLGRPLFRNETVRHLNGVRSDNRPENLVLKQSSATIRPTSQRTEPGTPAPCRSEPCESTTRRGAHPKPLVAAELPPALVKAFDLASQSLDPHCGVRKMHVARECVACGVVKRVTVGIVRLALKKGTLSGLCSTCAVKRYGRNRPPHTPLTTVEPSQHQSVAEALRDAPPERHIVRRKPLLARRKPLTAEELPPALAGAYDLSSQAVDFPNGSGSHGMGITRKCLDCGAERRVPVGALRTSVKNGTLSGLCTPCGLNKHGRHRPPYVPPKSPVFEPDQKRPVGVAHEEPERSQPVPLFSNINNGRFLY